MDDQTLYTLAIFHEAASKDEKQLRINAAKHQMAIRLMQLFCSTPDWTGAHFVLHFKEEVIVQPPYNRIIPTFQEYRLTVQVSLAQHREVKIITPAYDQMPLTVLSWTAADELRRRLTNTLQRWLRR